MSFQRFSTHDERTVVLNIDAIESYEPVWNGTSEDRSQTYVRMRSGEVHFIAIPFEKIDLIVVQADKEEKD